MSEYTPVTDEVRESYAGFDFDSGIAGDQFDRWHAEVERAAAEKAWDACIAAMRYTDGSAVELEVNINPYRRKEEKDD